MTINELYDLGVKQKHIRSFQQMRKENTHMVTAPKLDLKGFGQSLRSLREDADISLRDMAGRLDLSPSFLSDCELGERQLSISHTLLFLKHCKA
jgi:predicted transcriptional regulator